MNQTNLQNIASDGLFHQIALVSVKPLLTTTIIHELRESSDRNIDPEHDPMLCLGRMQFACTYLVLLDLARLLSHRTRLLVSADIATGASLKAKGVGSLHVLRVPAAQP
jgi:hypothetical protein